MTYYDYSKSDLLKYSKIPLAYFDTNEAIFESLANEMVQVIVENNLKDEFSVLICPVGPVGHYEYFVKAVNEQNISLKKVIFINMDEYLTDEKQWISPENRLSFRGFMQREVYGKIKPELLNSPQNRIFPDPDAPHYVQQVIDQYGKVDLCIGGIGINGHVAFNEPDERLSSSDFLELPTRILPIAPITQAVNAIGDLKGAIELMPQWCVTIGMKEIYQAKKIRLGVFRPWHYAVLRRAACGEATPQFPVTLLQQHSDISIYFSEVLA